MNMLQKQVELQQHGWFTGTRSTKSWGWTVGPWTRIINGQISCQPTPLCTTRHQP